jgi:hypothetical protein
MFGSHESGSVLMFAVGGKREMYDGAIPVAAALLGAESAQVVQLTQVSVQHDGHRGVDRLAVEGVGHGGATIYQPLHAATLAELRRGCSKALERARGGEKFQAFRDRMLAAHPTAPEEMIRDAWEAATGTCTRETAPKPVAPRLRRALTHLRKACGNLTKNLYHDQVVEDLDRVELLVGEALDRYEAEGCNRVEEFRRQVLEAIDKGNGTRAGATSRIRQIREAVLALKGKP